jgi:hypothetical protein
MAMQDRDRNNFVTYTRVIIIYKISNYGNTNISVTCLINNGISGPGIYLAVYELDVCNSSGHSVEEEQQIFHQECPQRGNEAATDKWGDIQRLA